MHSKIINTEVIIWDNIIYCMLLNYGVFIFWFGFFNYNRIFSHNLLYGIIILYIIKKLKNPKYSIKNRFSLSLRNMMNTLQWLWLEWKPITVHWIMYIPLNRWFRRLSPWYSIWINHLYLWCTMWVNYFFLRWRWLLELLFMVTIIM